MRRMTLLIAVAVAMAVMAPCVTSAASAAPRLVTDAYQLAGEESELALVGAATLVGTEQGPDTNVVRSFAPGGAHKVIASVTFHPGSPESFGDLMSFSASPTRIVVLARGTSYGKDYGGSYTEQLESGPLGGPLGGLTAGCLITPDLDETVDDEEERIHDHTAIAGDGEVVAYDSFGCLVVRDFASGLQRVIPLEATLDPVEGGDIDELPEGALLRVAGRLIAYRANPLGGEGRSSVVVYDIDGGRELYRVPLPPEGHPERGENRTVPTFDLQADGTLLVADPSSCTATVSTLADPSPRALGIPACYIRRVRDGRALIVVPGPHEEQLLDWTSIEAPASHLIADLGRRGILETVPPEMSETEVAYVLSGCYPRVYRTSLAQPGIPPGLAASCPVTASPRHATLTARSLRVRLLCPRGCRGSFTAWIGTAAQQRSGKGGEFLGSEPYTGSPARVRYSLAPGRPGTLTLPLTEEPSQARSLARRLRRDRHLRLVLYCYTYTPRMTGGSEAGAPELGVSPGRSTTVTVPIAAATAG